MEKKMEVENDPSWPPTQVEKYTFLILSLLKVEIKTERNRKTRCIIWNQLKHIWELLEYITFTCIYIMELHLDNAYFYIGATKKGTRGGPGPPQ